MDVYPCELNYDFEQDVHAHGKVAPYVGKHGSFVNNTRKARRFSVYQTQISTKAFCMGALIGRTR
jgi:hypothetical protein